MKNLVKVLLAIAALFLLMGLMKNVIAQNILTGAISAVAHVPVKAGGVEVRFSPASIRIKDLKVYNPSGFPDKLMLTMPQVFIDFVPGELLKGRAHLREVRLDLEELVVVRDSKGRLNVDAVKPTEHEKNEARQKAKAPAGQKAPQLFIDKLSLSIGKVVYKDYSTGSAQPSVQTFDINIRNREFRNIDNPTAIVGLLMFEALTRTTLSRLVNLDVNAFKEGGIQALSKGLGLVNDGSEKVQNTTKQILNLFK